MIQVKFDSRKLSFKEILDVFWKQIDPTTLNRQFADAGSQYRTAIFYHDNQQHRIAEQSKQEMDESGIYPAPILTEIEALKTFYPAEDYHQDYYKHNTERYKQYHYHSGRGQSIEKMRGDKK